LDQFGRMKYDSDTIDVDVDVGRRPGVYGRCEFLGSAVQLLVLICLLEVEKHGFTTRAKFLEPSSHTLPTTHNPTTQATQI